jgi:hypothetical protein
MRGLDTAAIISLLRADISRAGSVLAWAKKRRLDRTNVSRTLGGDRPPSRPIIEALGLRTIVVSDRKDGTNKSVREVDTTAVLSRLHSEIKRAGGPQAWARKHGIDRTLVSAVDHGRRLPTKRIITSLGFGIIVVPGKATAD